MGRLMLYFDPTGFLFVGPRTGLQLNIARSTFLDMHHRFSRFGIIYNAIATGVSSDYVQQINSMAIGAGLCHYFTKPIAQSVRLYTGICGEYGWGTTHNNVYDYDIKNYYFAAIGQFGWRWKLGRRGGLSLGLLAGFAKDITNIRISSYSESQKELEMYFCGAIETAFSISTR